MNIFTGRKYLAFKKGSPWYRYKRTRCLKHLFTIFGWSLSIRIRVTGFKDWVLESAYYRFGHVSPILTSDINVEFDSMGVKSCLDFYNDRPGFSVSNTELYCYSKGGKLIGPLSSLSWVFKNNCWSHDDNPGVMYSLKHGGYIGFSHRGATVFRLGDRIFDEDYVPREEDFTEKEWALYNRKLMKSTEEGDTISSFIPFNRRGAVVISNAYEARDAAIAFSNYIS